jgi:hypothetical protein
MSTSPVTSEPNVGLIIREREPLNLEYPFRDAEKRKNERPNSAL